MTLGLAMPLRFMAVGVANTLAGYSVIIAARYACGLGDVAANALGYAAGLLLGFVLNRQWTFAHRGRVSAAAWRFALVVAFAWAVNITGVLVLIGQGVIPALAHALGIAPYTAGVYLGCRRWVFAEPSAQVARGRLARCIR